jgi:hypothetical protein
MSNLYSSTTSITNGCLEVDHLVCCLPTFDGSRGIPGLEQIGKLKYFNNVFFFFLCTFMSLHASDENCENLILFEFFVLSQGVSLGSGTSDVHVAESSFRHLTFWMDLGWMA